VTAAERDLGEVARLYQRYGFFVLRRCQLILRQKAAAEDALQDVFVRVLRRESAGANVERPLAWLYRIADNVCFDVIRRGRVRALVAGSMDDVAGTHPAVELEERNATLAVLSELDERDQRICVMAFLDGMTQGEIATELALSRVTVNKRVQWIRDRAREVLSSAAPSAESVA
jgi:RNA polymerase sigma-70 factor (ECF subfamily)